MRRRPRPRARWPRRRSRRRLQPGKVVEYTPALPTAKGETKTTPGGVKYETLKEGTGPELKAGQTGPVPLRGQAGGRQDLRRPLQADRSARDASRLGEKIKGWQEALPGMNVGELRKLTVPPELAYGEKGRPPRSRPTRP